MARGVHWRLHSDVSWRDTVLTSLVTTGHMHVSQMNVVMIYLKSVVQSAYSLALITCSPGPWFALLLDVTGRREDWVHGHLI